MVDFGGCVGGRMIMGLTACSYSGVERPGRAVLGRVGSSRRPLNIDVSIDRTG